jgi:hypothetical protein
MRRDMDTTRDTAVSRTAPRDSLVANWRTLMIAACLAVSVATPALAQRAPGVVDGNAWLASSTEVRKAFLLGVGNMIALESAYAKRKGTTNPVAGAMATKAIEGMTLDQIANRITAWYEADPTRRTVPVMQVFWREVVDPRPVRP